MFDATQEKPETGTNRLWIGLFVVVAVVAVATLLYVMSKGTDKVAAPAPSAAVPVGKSDADAVHDLVVLRATMDKDRAGTTAVWLVQIKNRSKTYTYSDIKYETTYMGAENKVLLVNKGTISAGIGPDDENKSEIRDASYPPATAWYKIRVTGATPTVQ
jgi:hypothetical protein